MTTWRIGRLEKSHDRSMFDCGHAALNDWLKHRAGQFDRRDLSRTFVATHLNESAVVGFYAISSHRVIFDALPSEEVQGLPRLDVPVVLIGRLAVNQREQGQGLGSLLLVDALRRSASVSDQLGIRAVEVDALDEAARSFYLKFGFRSLLDDPRHMYLPMHEIRRLKLDPLP